MSCFEIYGNKLFDLLNQRKKLVILEDGKKKVGVHIIPGPMLRQASAECFFLLCNSVESLLAPEQQSEQDCAFLIKSAQSAACFGSDSPTCVWCQDV